MIYEEELMQEVADGNTKSLSKLVELYLPSAVSYAKYFSKNEAEDIVQDTFIRFWKYAPSWDKDKASPKTWFYRILKNVCYDNAKKYKKEYNTNSDDQINEIKDTLNIEDDFISKENAVILKNEILNLPHKEQQAIILTYYEERKNKETSELMNISLKNVEVLLVRARKKIKKRLVKNDK